MGYYTKYELTVDAPVPEISMVCCDAEREGKYCSECGAQLEKITSWEQMITEKVGYSPWDSECKWYSHHKDMIFVSQRYPDVLFTLDGEGEESGDLWRTYYKDGKSQQTRVIMTFEPFDETKLN